MLWSKNLIQQNDSVGTYNTFVRQINDMQKEEQSILDARLAKHTATTEAITEQLQLLLAARNQLVEKIKQLEVAVYYNSHR